MKEFLIIHKYKFLASGILFSAVTGSVVYYNYENNRSETSLDYVNSTSSIVSEEVSEAEEVVNSKSSSGLNDYGGATNYSDNEEVSSLDILVEDALREYSSNEDTVQTNNDVSNDKETIKEVVKKAVISKVISDLTTEDEVNDDVETIENDNNSNKKNDTTNTNSSNNNNDTSDVEDGEDGNDGDDGDGAGETEVVDPVDPVEPVEPTEPEDNTDEIEDRFDNISTIDNTVETITQEPNTELPDVELPNHLSASDVEVTYTVGDFFAIESTATINGNYEITYEVTNLPDFADFDSETGEVTGSAGYGEAGVYSFEISATARNKTVTYNVTLNIIESDVERALNGEDMGVIDKAEIVKYNSYLEAKDSETCEYVADGVYGTGEDSIFEATDFAGSVNLNWKTSLNTVIDENYSVLGNADGTDWMYYGDSIGTRYIVSGILLADSVSGDWIYEDSDFAANVFRFLSEDDDFFMSESKIFTSTHQANQLKTYLDKRGIEYNVTFSNVLDESIDFIWPQVTTDDTVDFAIENELPIIAQYNYHWRNNISYKRFGITMNFAYADNPAINDTENAADPCKNDFESFSRIFETLENDDLTFVNYDEACSVYATKRSCNMDTLQTEDGESYNYLLGVEISRLRNLISSLDSQNISVFDNDYRRLRLAVLYADSWRDTIEYNYYYNSTPDNIFYGAYFADSVVSYSRENSYAQKDLGTFVTNFEEVMELDTVDNSTFTFTPPSLVDNYSAGYYLQPGETLTIKRTDSNSDVTTKVFLNMQRNGSARVWEDYIRPEYLQTSHIVVDCGEEVTLSSPHGGLVYINTSAGNEADVSFEISNVVQTEVLRTSDEDDIASFVEYVNSTPLEYVDMETDYSSIHSWTTGMKNGFENLYGGDGEAYIEDINTYAILNNLAYAGFESEDIGAIDEDVAAWFLELGLDDYNNYSVHGLPRRQHFNVDNKVLCGNFCSGNPIDYQGTFNPLSTYTSHEMGHNLTRNHLLLYGGRSSEVLVELFADNSRKQQAIANGQHHYASVIGTQDEVLWYALNDYYLEGGEISVNAPYWTANTYQANQKHRLAIYLQIQQASGTDELYTMLNILDRLACYYDNSEATWEEYKDALGFSTYSQSEFQSISGNDFVLVAASYVGQKDMIEFFNGLTLETSDKAQEQVRSMEYDEVMEAGMYFVNHYDYSGKHPIVSEHWFMPFGEDNDYWPADDSEYWTTVANQYETKSAKSSTNNTTAQAALKFEDEEEIIVASEEVDEDSEEELEEEYLD